MVMIACPHCGEKFEVLARDLVVFRANRVKRHDISGYSRAQPANRTDLLTFRWTAHSTLLKNII